MFNRRIVFFYSSTLESEKVATATEERTAQVEVRENRGYLLTKRIFDMIVALAGGAVLLIPMAIIGVLIKLDSKGPAIYRQERLGKNGKPFIMLKFRSMTEDAEAEGPRWADKDDERCTKLGSALRKSRLDELPQLWNILKGDMSFVGPRPERACFYHEFEKYIPHFRDRLLVKPGLTGHAQVNGGYDLLPEEKIVYDLEYMRKRSWKMDLQCIWKTVAIILNHDGAR